MGLVSTTKTLLRKLWLNEKVGLRKYVDGWRIVFWSRRSTGRVDPAAFDPDEFPVICLECGYELRGDVVGVCSECGTEYERGRSLVRIYMKAEQVRRSTVRIWGNRLWVLGFVLLGISMATFMLLRYALWSTIEPFLLDSGLFKDPLHVVIKSALCLFGLKIAGCIALYAGGFMRAVSPVKDRSKCAKEITAWVREHRPWED